MKVIPPNRLEAEKGIPYTPDHQRRLVKAGKFPAPMELGPGRVAYDEADIDAWLEQRKAARSSRGKAA